MGIEKYLIDHCASTLASLKAANMFTIRYETEKELFDHIGRLNRDLNQKGVFVTVLRLRSGLSEHTRKTALIYVYRAKYISRILSAPDTSAFLQEHGYRKGCSLSEALARLREHVNKEDFPHEIGIFLGYPLEDVIGFIENGGRNSLCTGCWKVYCNPSEAQKMFCKFHKCRNVYRRMWEEGKSILQLTVAR